LWGPIFLPILFLILGVGVGNMIKWTLFTLERSKM
jgi:hypothetical protein